jgi:hypothetical protein
MRGQHFLIKKGECSRAPVQDYMPVILATQEAEIRRIAVQSQPKQIVLKTLSQKKLLHTQKKWTGRVAQGIGPEFKPQYRQTREEGMNKQTVLYLYNGTLFSN